MIPTINRETLIANYDVFKSKESEIQNRFREVTKQYDIYSKGFYFSKECPEYLEKTAKIAQDALTASNELQNFIEKNQITHSADNELLKKFSALKASLIIFSRMNDEDGCVIS